MRVLIVVLSLDRAPWRDLEEAQRATWASCPHPGVDVIYVRGVTRGLPRALFLAGRKLAERMGARKRYDLIAGRISVRKPVRIRNEVVHTRTPEYWIGTSAKMHAGLKSIVDAYQFDYLVRTNSSTYLDVPRLIDHLRHSPKEKFYSGADQGVAHAQGTCIILSRDAARSVAEDRSWDYDKVDDVAIGLAACRAGIRYVPVEQVTVGKDQVVPEPSKSGSLSPFVYRSKTRSDRTQDIEAMRRLHQMLRAC